MRTLYLIAFLFLIGTVVAQEKFRLCAPYDAISESTCNALQRGDSQVSCIRVQDSSECVIKINRGEADFGIFTAEEALLAYQFYPADTQVIAQLKNKWRVEEPYEFKSVAVVRSNYTAGSFNDLKQSGFCHPGFSQTQTWNDNILKYFERKVVANTCNSTITAAENEAINLKNYFGTACRPGSWVAEPSQDAVLKQKYPELCAACDNTTACRYANTDNHGHIGALECLTAGKGGVAYAALTYVYQYFGINSTVINGDVNPENLGPLVTQYKFLCADGLLDSLYSSNPCSWIRQPWEIIAARKEIAAALQANLKSWVAVDPSVEVAQDWKGALASVLQEKNNIVEYSLEFESLATYLSRGRELTSTTPICGDPIRWCTVSTEETTKCDWVAQAAITHGVQPSISCTPANSTFHCFRKIAKDTADIMTIDSNYGHLAREVFNLSTILYTETAMDQDSVIIAVVRSNETNVRNFASIKSRGVCFPEYGGIAWLSFVNATRQNGVISDSCDYPGEVSNLVSAACTPGWADADHHNRNVGSTTSNLCSLCPVESNNASCSANSSNIYYGDKGALECLASGAGDVAVIEVKNLDDEIKSGVIDSSKYKVLCKNGSLASYTGFKVDKLCALSVTIDSEVMGRSSRSEINTTNTVLALLKLENWLGYRANTVRPIHMYGPFNNTRNLLFKDSTTGLETTSSTLQAVKTYKELFAHVESCKASGAITVLASLSTILLTLFVQYL